MRLEEALSEASHLNALMQRTQCACDYYRVQSTLVAELVNLQIAGIFKRILNLRNPAQNGKKFAKSGGRKIWIARVYHTGVNHDAALRETNGLLTPDASPIVREECREAAIRTRRITPHPSPLPMGEGVPSQPLRRHQLSHSAFGCWPFASSSGVSRAMTVFSAWLTLAV